MILLTDLIALRRRPAAVTRRALPPGVPDLVRESEHRTAYAAAARQPLEAYDRRPRSAPRVTDGWPDPCDLDPVVFGPAPHRGALWRGSGA